jgi:thiol:disulfide interchange protein
MLATVVAAAICGCGGAAGRRTIEEPSRLSEQGTGAISWRTDYGSAAQEAGEAGTPLMVDVGADWCTPCKQLDEFVFSRADVAEASKAFVPVKVDGDKRSDLRKQWGVKGYPTVIFLTAEGEEIERVVGAVGHRVMLDAMARAAGKVDSSEEG